MTIVINSWQLDTCSCVLHYYWDDSVPPDQIVTTFFAVENACAAHEKLIGLDKGEPDWEQPDHTVESENAARFAIIDNALSTNETRNIQDMQGKPAAEIAKIQARLSGHNQEVVNRYSNIFALTNVKAISKGIWNSGVEENKRKNDALQTILDNGPAALYDLEGSNRLIKKGIKLNLQWAGDPPNRILTLTLTGVTLTTNQRNTIQNKLNTLFGPGKVILG